MHPVDDLVERQHVGVLLVHVEQVDGVRRLVAVEHALLGDDHAVAVGAAVDDGGADAAARALAGHDEGVDAEGVEVAGDGRAPEGAGRRLAEERLPLNGLEFGNDVVLALHVGAAAAHVAGASASLPAGARPPGDAGLLVGQAGYVDDRHADLARRGEQALDVRERLPRGESAAAGPRLDSLHERLRAVAEHPPVQVDHQEGGAVAEALDAVSAGLDVLAVGVGEEPFPDSLGHDCLLWCIESSYAPLRMAPPGCGVKCGGARPYPSQAACFIEARLKRVVKRLFGRP